MSRLLASLEPGSQPDDRSAWSHSRGPNGMGFEVWCSTVATAEARSLAGILDDTDTADSVSRDVIGLRYEFAHRDLDDADVTVRFEPVLPRDP